MELSLLSFLSLGFVLGLKHATDADHVAAVTTFITHERSWLRTCWIGLFWGAGHTVALAVVGVSVVLFQWHFPDWLEPRLELVVAAMLVVLGLRGMYLAGRGRALTHSHLHLHGGGAVPHSHWHFHTRGGNGHETWLHVGLRPLLTGLVHGAAGSGALMVLVLSTVQSSAVSLLYVFIFGLGSIAGMIIVSSIVALPARWFQSTQEFSRALQMGAGLFSCVLGMALGVGLV